MRGLVAVSVYIPLLPSHPRELLPSEKLTVRKEHFTVVSLLEACIYKPPETLSVSF
jgi:hypothetical protein